MSPQAATALLSFPPVRGFLALLFLVLLGGVPLQDGDLGIWSRIGVGVGLLLLGAVVWIATLRGFLRDVREPRRREDAVVVANRPRRFAVAVSWLALVLLVVALLSVGVIVRLESPAWVILACTLAVLLGLAVATALPRLSRWYADAAGLVAVSPLGLSMVPDRGEVPEPVPWPRVGQVLPAASTAESLVHDAADGLGPRVRWKPGAQQAVARWARDGFAPTASEVRDLHLERSWSPDPDAQIPSRSERWSGVLGMGWAVLACVLMAVALFAVVALGRAPWWLLLIVGWAPVLALVILAPRLVRMLRTDERRSAEVTGQGWVDHLHAQGLVPWEHIDLIEVHERYAVVISTPEAPPFRDADLGNRLNHRLDSAMESWPQKIPSAGPLFREIGPHHLPYPPSTRFLELVEEAERRGSARVWRGEGDRSE